MSLRTTLIHFISLQVGHLETICTNCKGQIINFHNFKEKVKTNLEVEPQKIEILEEVKKFLYSSDEHLTVLKHDKSLSIVPTNTLNVVDISEDATSWTDEVLFEPSVENDSINLLQKPPIIAATNYQYTKNLESRQFKRKRDGISPSS